MRTLLLFFMLSAVSLHASAQVPQRWQLPLSKQFPQQIMQTPSGDRALIQVYDTIYNWNWDVDMQQWELMYRNIDIQYDDNYELIGAIGQTWNGNAWENTTMSSVAVSDDGMTIIFTQMIWVDNAWVNSERSITLMDPVNNSTMVTIQNWTGGVWLNEYRWILQYNEDQLVESETDQIWEEGEWINASRYLYTYDAENNMLDMLIQEWQGTDWGDMVWYAYTYFPNNNLSGQVERFYFENMWVNSTKDTLYTYDGQNNMTGYTSYVWTGEDWMNMMKIENTYDVQNNRTSSLLYQWMNQWTLTFREISKYTYDENDFIVGESVKNYDGIGTLATWGDSTYYIYHTVITGSGQVPLADASIAVWPNPGRDVFNISSLEVIHEIEVFDLSGHRMQTLQSVGQSASKIDLTDAPKGAYILRLQTDNGIHQRKIIKQ